MKATKREIFDEQYRVLAVESQSLTIQGVRTGEVLTIVNQTPGVALQPCGISPRQTHRVERPYESAGELGQSSFPNNMR